MNGPGKVYLIGSSHGGTVRDVFRRAAGQSPPTVAVSFAALPHVTGHASHRRQLASFMPAGSTIERFAVRGEEDAMTAAEARGVIERASIVFLGGGDPVLCAERLVDAGADGWIRSALARGAACVGLSAGSIALGAYWASWPEDDPTREPTVVRCIGAAPDLVVDCHAEADDWEELREVRRHLGERAARLRFVGIGHGSAVIVGEDGGLEWLGKAHELPRVEG